MGLSGYLRPGSAELPRMNRLVSMVAGRWSRSRRVRTAGRRGVATWAPTWCDRSLRRQQQRLWLRQVDQRHRLFVAIGQGRGETLLPGDVVVDVR